MDSDLTEISTYLRKNPADCELDLHIRGSVPFLRFLRICRIIIIKNTNQLRGFEH